MMNGSLVLEAEDRPHFHRWDVPFHMIIDSAVRDALDKKKEDFELQKTWDTIRLKGHDEQVPSGIRVYAGKVEVWDEYIMSEDEMDSFAASELLGITTEKLFGYACTAGWLKFRKPVRTITGEADRKTRLRMRYVYKRSDVEALAIAIKNGLK